MVWSWPAARCPRRRQQGAVSGVGEHAVHTNSDSPSTRGSASSVYQSTRNGTSSSGRLRVEHVVGSTGLSRSAMYSSRRHACRARPAARASVCGWRAWCCQQPGAAAVEQRAVGRPEHASAPRSARCRRDHACVPMPWARSISPSVPAWRGRPDRRRVALCRIRSASLGNCRLGRYGEHGRPEQVPHRGLVCARRSTRGPRVRASAPRRIDSSLG